MCGRLITEVLPGEAGTKVGDVGAGREGSPAGLWSQAKCWPQPQGTLESEGWLSCPTGARELALRCPHQSDIARRTYAPRHSGGKVALSRESQMQAGPGRALEARHGHKKQSEGAQGVMVRAATTYLWGCCEDYVK